MGEAKRRKKGTAWQTQIVLCYEQEPYVAFDVTSELLEEAIAAENPPTSSEEAVQEWLFTSLTQLREDVALIRDHSDEVFGVPERRDRMTCKAVLLMQYLLARKGQRLATVPAVLLNLSARQAKLEPDRPGFQLAVLSEPLSAEDIRALSTTNHLYEQMGDTITQYNNEPRKDREPSKDRNKERACIAIQAFWHNEQPGGIMIGVEANLAEGQTSLDAEMEVLDQLVMHLAATQPTARDCDEYLRHMAQQPCAHQPDTDPVSSFNIMATIAYAEEAGYIPSDEFNGMVYIYRIDEDGFFVDRKDLRQTPGN